MYLSQWPTKVDDGLDTEPKIFIWFKWILRDDQVKVTLG